jgi:hypothetical protein
LNTGTTGPFYKNPSDPQKTLIRNPSKVGELIEGLVELTSGNFWSACNGVYTKVTRQLTGYFKTNLSSFLPEEKSIFKQIK